MIFFKLIVRCFAACLLCLVLSSHAAHADDGSVAKNLSCNNYSPLETMFKDVCWSGMFPFRLMGATFMDGKSGVPEDANTDILCKCGGDLSKGQLPRIGFTLGFWAPSKIMDVTRKPYCMPSLGGV